MGVRRKAFLGATAISAGLAVGGTAHAPKRIVLVLDGADIARPAQHAGTAIARAPLMPWPLPFAGLADYAGEEPDPSVRRPVRLPKAPAKRSLADVRPLPNDNPTVGAATPYVLPGPIAIEPTPYAMPIGPARDLPSPVTNGPFVAPPLADEQQDGFVVPTIGAGPPAFPFGVDPLVLDPPTVGAGYIPSPSGGLVSVPEPTTLCSLVLAPLMLRRRRKAQSRRRHDAQH